MAILKYKSSDGTWKSIVTKGGGSIVEETDPIFSASPAASITEEKKAAWDAKQDAINDLDAIRSGAGKGATALQEHQSLSNYYTKSEVDSKIASSITNAINASY